MPADNFSLLAATAREIKPRIGLVLGSGMSDVVSGLVPERTLSFAETPGLGNVTVAGHHGRISLGTWAGKPVLVFAGRLHFYEAHTWDIVTTPIRIAHALGIRRLLVTNAAGGIRDDLQAGSLMVIRNQIECNRPNWWRELFLTYRNQYRSSPYSPELSRLLLQARDETGVDLEQGVYASVTGPCYETRAEIRALQHCGADAVGMSTTREVLTAHELGIECAGLSCITNKAAGLSNEPLSHDEVLTTAASQHASLARLLERFVQLAG